MKKLTWSFAASVALSISAPAMAADMAVKAAPAPAAVAAPSPWDIAFGAAVMNDYIFRGVSQSNHKPSVAAYFEPRYNVTKDFQLYVGLSGESINFPNHAAAEIDFYGGARWTLGPVVLDGGFWYYYYPGGQCFNGPAFGADCFANSGGLGVIPSTAVTIAGQLEGNVIKKDLSFYEFYFKPTWNVNDQLALGLNEFYSPSFLHSGAWGNYLSGTAKYTAPSNMAIGPLGWYVSGEFGRQWLGTSDNFYGIAAGTAIATGGFTTGIYANGIPYKSYDTWNVGLGLTYKVFTLDLRYSDTNLSKGDCNAFTSDFTASGSSNVTAINPSGLGSKWCGAAFIAKLSADLTLANLK
jgi:uncharacterized protein (TIGR02001 family)